MLMITRTDSLVELGYGDGSRGDRARMAFDVAHIASAMLCAERAPCGRVARVLALAFDNGAPILRIEGSAAELSAVHQTVTEIMLEAPPRRTVN